MRRGRYRISITGLRCNSQTWDDALNRGGLADEVLIQWPWKSLDSEGRFLDGHDHQNTTMGDIARGNRRPALERNPDRRDRVRTRPADQLSVDPSALSCRWPDHVLLGQVPPAVSPGVALRDDDRRR
jgi:hypothetical protein